MTYMCNPECPDKGHCKVQTIPDPDDGRPMIWNGIDDGSAVLTKDSDGKYYFIYPDFTEDHICPKVVD